MSNNIFISGEKMGYKTKQRELILSLFKDNPDHHFTAEEITDILRKDNSPVGKVTVYRHLDKMISEGLVQKYSGECACYQYHPGITDNEKFHLKCLSCGKLYHLDCDLLKKIHSHIYDEHSFDVDNLRTVFYGKCSECSS